jgi:hypothetical protein
METVIDRLSERIADRFGGEVATIYFGDVGVYPPRAFLLPRGEQGAVVLLIPSSNRLVEGSRVASQEDRLLNIDVVVMVNLTPYFSALPAEAPAERKLVQLTSAIHEYLTSQSLVDLDGLVRFSKVGDIEYAWTQRGDLSVRAGVINYQARVKVSR